MRIGLANQEVSGKGSQIFMITVVVTPVHLRGVACIMMERQDYLLDGELIEQKVREKIKFMKSIYGHIFLKCKRKV